MTGFLSAKPVSVFAHFLVDESVANRCFHIVYSGFVKGFVKSYIAHYGSHDRVLFKLAALFEIFSADIEYVVAGDHFALVVNSKTSVGIAVESKADVKRIFTHKSDKGFYVRGSTILVYIYAVGRVVYHKCPCSKSVKYRLGYIPCASVGAVKTYSQIFKRAGGKRYEVAYIAVSAERIVESGSYFVPQRRLRLAFQPVYIPLYAVGYLLAHFLACG